MTKLELSLLDREFASYLKRRWSATDEVAGLGAQLSAALRDGNSALPCPAGIDLAPPCVGVAGSRSPLIADQGLVFLNKLWVLEDRIARELLSRCQPLATKISPKVLSLADEILQTEGPQRAGALLPFQSGLSVITGGPGTGKTWVLGRLLALQMAHRGTLPRVALAAPTGKAAQRMAEALKSSAETLPQDIGQALVGLVPQTLHRLLLQDSPLPYDLVVVDEASMVDLHLADRLLAALAPETGLVLLGDPDQLPSVDAGRVLSDIVEVLSAHQPCPVVRLVESRRFDDGQAVGIVAKGILSRSLQKAIPVLEAAPVASSETTSFRLVTGLPRAALVDELALGFGPFWSSPSPGVALENLQRFLVLTPTNEGPWGQLGLNQALSDKSPPGSPRPIMITENDASTGLSNGDFGVIWSEGGRQLAWFGSGQALQSRSIALLGPHQTAYAVTIHKSQGSEFNRLAIVLPPPDAAGRMELSRELLYTAVTRARNHGILYGAWAQLQGALSTSNLRHSGLANRLRAWQKPAS